MVDDQDQPPQYTRYRARPQLWPGRSDSQARLAPERPRPERTRAWRERITAKRVLLGLLALILGWLVLSLVLFLISSHFERSSPPSNVVGVLDGSGFPLTSANNILVL